MKKLNKLLIGLSIPTTAMAILPLVSCGNKEKALTLDLQHDENVKGLTTEGETMTNKSFKVVASLKNGWRQIDSSKTYIEVDGTKLTEGTDKDYEIKGTDTILVHANVIKSVNVKVFVGVKATYLSDSYVWKELGSLHYEDKTLLLIPNDIISSNNLDITVTLGDGSVLHPNCGTGVGEYTVKIGGADGQDITEQFGSNDGFKVLASHIDTSKSGPTNLYLTCFYKASESQTVTIQLHVYAGNIPTSLTISSIDPCRVNEEYSIYARGGKGEYGHATFEIVAGETTISDAEIRKGTVTDLLFTGTTTGTIKVKATSIFGDVSAEKTYTVTAA